MWKTAEIQKKPLNREMPFFSLTQFLLTLTTAPGIYQMCNDKNTILYIGKARNLKKRVSSYFQKTHKDSRLIAMVRQIHHIEVIITQNESEAFLLENQLIKKYQPKYNILLRDDKSYPFIVITGHDYPRLNWHRKKNKIITTPKNKNIQKENVYGPYPSATAVRHSVRLMQKLFKLRVCRDSFFKNRTRPCLLYQIKKCTGPCVDLISRENYQEEVKLAKLLLQGKNQEVLNQLVQKMQHASEQLEYEKAAYLRDQMAYLRHIQTQQVAVTSEKGMIDVFALVTRENVTAIGLLWIREGRVWGNQTFYPTLLLEKTPAEILSAFLGQYYLDKPNIMPAEIVLPEKCKDQLYLERMFTTKITIAKQGDRRQWCEMAEKTAQEALKSKFLNHAHIQDKLDALVNFLHLQKPVEQIVCVDISHHLGESTIGACVVMGREGVEKKNYRRFNIQGVQAGDDCAAIHQTLEKYFSIAQKIPDILLIDGGKGQIREADIVLEKLNLKNITLLSMAKGVSRRPGFEQIFINKQKAPLGLDARSPAFYVLQQIRDEAHKFAITSHRKKQSQKRRISILENIAGIGAKKRHALLQYLGGLQEIKKADVNQLSRVPGIRTYLAEKIYDYFHGQH